MFDMGEEIQQDATVTDDPGTGECKKVRESFCLSQRGEEKEEDTMLC